MPNHREEAERLLGAVNKYLNDTQTPFEALTALQMAQVEATLALQQAIDDSNWEPCPQGCGRNKRKSFRTCRECSGQGGGGAPRGYGADGAYSGAPPAGAAEGAPPEGRPNPW